MATVAEELVALVERLAPDQQRRVLDYARDLAQSAPAPRSVLPPGPPASALLNFRPTMSPEDVEAMRRAIEEDCETIEPDEF